MADIATKLTYLNNTKDLFKDRLNSLGAEITSSTTFRNYLNWLDTFYGDASDKTDLSVNGVVGRTSQNTAGLPSEYTQVDYIESSGTQYIDTGIKGNQDMKVNLDFEATNFSYAGNKTIIGGRKSSIIKHYAITMSPGDEPYLYSGYNNVTQKGEQISLNTKYNVFKDKNITYLDNTEMANTTYATFETPTNMYIFAMNEGGAKFYSSIKLFTLKIYNDNELVRNFIPCYRNSDNEVGLYDIVNDVFYTNQGTGAFTYGEVVINNLSGDVPYKVSGKNKLPFPYTESTHTHNGVTFTVNNDGSVLVNGTATGGNANTELYGNYQEQNQLKFPGKYLSGGTNNVRLRAINNHGGEYVVLAVDTGTGTEIDTSTYDVGYIEITVLDDTTINNQLIKPMVLDSLEDTTYEPYISQTFNIPLGDIELCKIDTYEDKIYSSNGRFYLYKVINKVIFDGSESWTNTYGESLFDIQKYFNSKPFIVGYGLSNYYRYNSIQSGLNAGLPNREFALQSSTAGYNIFIKNTSFTNVTNFKNWLSTHNTIVYYPLETPTTTEITQENYPSLYNALKQIQDYLTAYKINKEFILGYSSPEIDY